MIDSSIFCLANLRYFSLNQPPVAVTAANPPATFVGDIMTFSSVGSYDPDGSIVSYNWDFGDGTTSNEADPTQELPDQDYFPDIYPPPGFG